MQKHNRLKRPTTGDGQLCTETSTPDLIHDCTIMNDLLIARTSRASTAIRMMAVFLCSVSASSVQSAPQGWDLVWNDEFEGTTVDPAKWTKEVTNSPANNELQAYIADQVTVADGNLVITSENIPTNGKQYRSGRVHSNFTKQYGRWEVRADLPTSRGMWPAIWLLPNTSQHNWPSQGEIDIMENRGNQPYLTSSAFHWGTNPPYNHQFRFSEQTTARFGEPVNFHEGYHVFAVEWDETKLRFFVDDVHHWTLYNSDANGFLSNQSAPMWTMLNTAVGGDFLPNPDGSTIWPQQFKIDYVRIYDRNDDPIRFRNGRFEVGEGSLAGWTVFGNELNANNVSVHHEAIADGAASLKLFGQFISRTNYSGVSQGMTVAPGQEVRATAESFIRSQDSIAGTGNTVQMKIEFYSDFGGRHGRPSLLDEVITTIATASTANDVWSHHELSAVAPAGAVEARVAFVFIQPAAGGGGSVHIDNVTFENLSVPLSADANGDGNVDGADFLIWQRNLGGSPDDGATSGDFNWDGTVDDADLNLWKSQSAPAAPAQENHNGASTNIPEPAGAVLTLSGLAGLMQFRRAQRGDSI